ncbi:complex 1 protein (LYR family) domain-containing protein [Ditylenchus destructor]|uniref:Complex 1 protein (LYR family) domain-containing protein n=1 Tax=Ditylenchus destructor TaxID=166010 RepID=A0AAD4RBR9_9BILA|nr:complex 1 protein (LYR family) domain-containing protein [Ditylenchus destructor]
MQYQFCFSLLDPPLSPVCAIVGSIIGQEAIKALSQNDPPLKNAFFYSALDTSGIHLMSRQRVLSTYRRILRLGKNWTAQNPEDTLKEREYIKEEARKQFKAHSQSLSKALTYPNHGKKATPKQSTSCLETPIRELKFRAITEYRTNGHLICTRQLLMMSTPSPKPSKFARLKAQTYPSSENILAYPHELRSFLSRYFAGVPIPEHEVISFVTCLKSNPEIDQLFSCDLRNNFPGKINYETNVLKNIIQKVPS